MRDRIILDGGMGTMLQAAGLGLGERPEVFGIEHPDVVERIQRSYVEAGSQVLYANTFGANAHKLEGTGHTVEEAVSVNVATDFILTQYLGSTFSTGATLSAYRFQPRLAESLWIARA